MSWKHEYTTMQLLPDNVLRPDEIIDINDEIRGTVEVPDSTVVRSDGNIGGHRTSSVGRVELFGDKTEVIFGSMYNVEPFYEMDYDMPHEDYYDFFDSLKNGDDVKMNDAIHNIFSWQAPLGVNQDVLNWSTSESNAVETAYFSSDMVRDLEDLCLLNPSTGTMWRAMNSAEHKILPIPITDVEIVFTNEDPDIIKQEDKKMDEFRVKTGLNVVASHKRIDELESKNVYMGFSGYDLDKYKTLSEQKKIVRGFEFNPVSPISARMILWKKDYASYSEICYRRKKYNTIFKYMYDPPYFRYPPDSFRLLVGRDVRSNRECFNFISSEQLGNGTLHVNSVHDSVIPDWPLVLQGIVPYVKRDSPGLMWGRTTDGEFVVEDDSVLEMHGQRLLSIAEKHPSTIRPEPSNYMDSVTTIHYSAQRAGPVLYDTLIKSFLHCCPGDVSKYHWCLRTRHLNQANFVSNTGILFMRIPEEYFVDGRPPDGAFPIIEHRCDLFTGEIFSCDPSKYRRGDQTVFQKIYDDTGRILYEVRCDIASMVDVNDKATFTSGIDIHPVNIRNRLALLKKVPFESWKDIEPSLRHNKTLGEVEVNDFLFDIQQVEYPPFDEDFSINVDEYQEIDN